MGYEYQNWKRIELIDADVCAIKNNQKKLRMLSDENISYEIVDELSIIKTINHKHVYEIGLSGKPDSVIFQYAIKANRIILTHDTDFLDDDKFPINISPGIVVLPGSRGCFESTLLGLVYLCHTFKDQHKLLSKSKITINSKEASMKIKSLNWDGQKTETEYLLNKGVYRNIFN